MRFVGLWILLVAVYAATLGIPAQPGMDYAGNEPHHLLAAESLVSDRDVDLSDEYRERAYASWYPGELKTDGRIVDRRLVEPHGVGFALLIAPSYALGGARAVQWQMLAMLALAFVLAAALARRMVPEPWATVGVGLVGLSPPAVAASTTITPGIAAAVLLAGAALCALAIRERPRRRYVVVGALLLAGLPWLGWSFVAAGVVVAWALVVWTLRRAAALRGVGGRRAAGRLAGLLRHRQRPLLRRHHAPLRRNRRAAGPAVRLRRAAAAARRPVAGPGGRPAALGAADRARVLRRAGCSTAPAATSSPAWPRRGGRPRPPPGCCSR